MLPKTPTIVLMILLILVALGLLIWAIINQQRIKSEDLLESPFTLKFTCPNSSAPIPVYLDKNKGTFETVNFCTVNAPPESLTEALGRCEDPNLIQKIPELRDFYQNKYLPTCGKDWKSANGMDFQNNLELCAEKLNL